MVTQSNARSTTSTVRRRLSLHFPGRPRLRPTLQESRTIDSHSPNVAHAGLQLLVGYEWLLAGGDKLLLGTFPFQLGGMLLTLVKNGHLVGFFAATLHGLVAPNAVFFGYLIELGEALAGLGLMVAGLMVLLRPLARHSLGGTSMRMFIFGDRLIERLAPLAAFGAGLLAVSYFFLDGLPAPWFVPGTAFGGSIDTGLFLALASVVLIVSQFVQRYQH